VVNVRRAVIISAPAGFYLCLATAAVLFATVHHSGLGYEWLFFYLVTFPWSGLPLTLRWATLAGFLINFLLFLGLGFCIAKAVED
jgi:hypothetical protein